MISAQFPFVALIPARDLAKRTGMAHLPGSATGALRPGGASAVTLRKTRDPGPRIAIRPAMERA